MKVFKFILKLILGVLLTLSLFGFIVIGQAQKTVLNKDYVLDKMEEDNYYNNLYSNIINELKGYIGPSGFDEKVFNDIISSEKVKEDTIKVIENIYDGNENNDVEIETESIKQKLDSNIDKFLEEENLVAENKESLNEYENKIAQEYEDSVTYSKYYRYAKKVTSSKITNIIKIAKIGCVFGIILSVIGIILINLKKYKKILSEVMTFIFANGIIIRVLIKYITTKIKISYITVLNTSFSIVLRDILQDIIDNISKVGTTLIIVSLIIIVLNNLVFVTKDEDYME
ncbi:MAG: hypothetical protein IKF52_06105 [Clostridia bacterium]|nr:hypothetical protein [Clostridia bacterium]